MKRLYTIELIVKIPKVSPYCSIFWMDNVIMVHSFRRKC